MKGAKLFWFAIFLVIGYYALHVAGFSIAISDLLSPISMAFGF